jgi:hypothetical protein
LAEAIYTIVGTAAGESAMQPGTYAITHFMQMLEKARRDLERFVHTPHLDHALNFCMTIYHVYDYVKVHVPDTHDTSLTRVEINKRVTAFFKTMFDDPDFDTCHCICNKAKHLELKNTGKYQADSEMRESSGAVLGRMGLGTPYSILGTPPRPILFVDGKEVEFLPFAERVLQRWEGFLRSKNLIA